ncbi:MAG: hypothetical protein AAF850_13585 [Pseudomonadota bacterium]
MSTATISKMEQLRRDVNRITLWMVMTPFLAAWPIASFLPLINFFAEGQTALSIFMNIFFLGTSFLAVAGGYAFAYLSATPEARLDIDKQRRGSAPLLAGCAFVWLTFFTLWGFLN